MKKTIGDYREILKCLAGKDFDAHKSGVVLNHIRNVDKMIIHTLPDKIELPKEAEEQFRELELLAME